MEHISELSLILNKSFGWHKSRLDCFCGLLLALFIERTVNLGKLASSFFSKAEINSRYKRLQRFFRYFQMEQEQIARFIFKLFFTPQDKIYLTLDRTNWYYGKKKINILTVGITYEGIAIPMIWDMLNKAGNATANEHIAAIKRFIKIFGQELIIGVLADREFGSASFFKWLKDEKIPFYIRVKEGCFCKIRGKKFIAISKFFNHLNVKNHSVAGMSIELFGQKIYLAGARSERGELMIVATNQLPKNAIAIYLRRWEIECLFSCLKTRGFCFEDTHMTHLDRISKLMSLLALGFAWAHKTGEWRANKKAIRLKQHRESRRSQYSFFRYGMDFIHDIIINPCHKMKKFLQCIAILELGNSNEHAAF